MTRSAVRRAWPDVRRFLLAICLCGLSAAAHAAWPTTSFEVVQPLNPLSERLSTEQADKVAAVMGRYAKEYERRGWPAPFRTKMNSGKTAYLVIVEEYSGRKGPPRVDALCAAPPSAELRLFIDPRHWNDSVGTAAEAKNWQDLAHEMFHLIQGNYEPFKTCPGGNAIGDWIAEGTAEAMGIYMAQVVESLRPYTFCQIGARSYADHLYMADDAADRGCGNVSASYQTSAFWEFLGEWKAKKAIPTPTRTTRPDYRYLRDLFATAPTSFDEQSEYVWMDGRLKEQFGFGLREAYTRFAASYSGYWSVRRNDYRGRKPASAEKWHSMIYTSCTEVPPGQFGQKFALALNSYAAKCLRVQTPGGGQRTLEITATGDVKKLADLTMSVDSGKQFARATLKPKKTPNRATFRFSIGGTAPDEHYFIIANAASAPDRGFLQQIELSIALASSGSTSATPTKKSNGKKQRQDTSDEAYADEYADNESADSWQGSVQQVQSGRTCAKAFIDRVCGQRTRITLELTPDQITAITTSLADPSPLAAARRAGQLGSAEQIDGLMGHAKRLAHTEGSRVVIEIPRIDYGYSGSFSNAFIRMNAGLSADRSFDYFDTKGPAWQGGCRDGHHAYSGSVTIEEASVQMLRGQFAADVVEPDKRGKYFCRDMPVYKSITGTFAIPGPALDRKSQDAKRDPQDVLDQIMDASAAAAPGMITPDMREAMRETVEAATERKRQRRREREAQIALEAATCDCRCDRAGQNIRKPGCYQQCEPSYQQCTAPSGDQIAALYNLTRAPTDQENQTFDRMRADIEQWLANEPKRYVRDALLNQFDQAPHMMKQQVYDQIKARYAP